MRLFILLCSLTLCCIVTLPVEVNSGGVTSKLYVHIPKNLSKKEGYDHREALFGVPPYGGSIQQNVYFADADLCTSDVDTHKGYPARPNDENGQMASWPSPFILMVERGGCSFVAKVRNAQRAGAAAVIIADNTCLCSRKDVCKPEDGAECETNEPIMADDGSGADISIPSMLMYKEDVDPIKAALLNNQTVRMGMVWALDQEGTVDYNLWTTPTDIVSRSFLHQFKVAATALIKHAKFTPHMYIYDGIRSGCQGFDGENQCYNLCTNNGRYCATDPDNDLDVGISGADVVAESLRRICIWKLYGQDGVGGEWWDYITEFMFRCDNADYFTSLLCAKDAMTRAKVDFHKVANCISDSGGLEADGKNMLLESEMGEKLAAGVVIIPSMYVNSAPIRGALTFQTVFKAICAGFDSRDEPQVCKQCASCNDEFSCVSSGHCKGQAPAGGVVSVPIFVISMAALILCFGIVGLIQWRRSQSQMREQVRGIMAQYMPLDENKTVESVGIEDGEFS